MSERPSWRVLTGRAEDHLPTFEAESFDGCACDPPYGLRFMGKAWDHGVPGPEIWREVLRCLKPGAFLLAFGGTRTYHRLACAIEDAGFEIRDCVVWLHGQGFPKSLDISAAIDKRRTEDLEPVRRVCRFIRSRMDSMGVKASDLTAHFGDCHSRLIDHWAARDSDSQPSLPTAEQWRVLRSVLSLGSEMDAEVDRLNGRKGTTGHAWQSAEVVGEHTGQLPGLGGERFNGRDNLLRLPATDDARTWEGYGTALKPAWEPCIVAMKPLDGTFAANALKHGVAGLNVDGCRIEVPDGDRCRDLRPVTRRKETVIYGGFTSEVPGKQVPLAVPAAGRWPANVILDEKAAELIDRQSGESTSAGGQTSLGAFRGGQVYGSGRDERQAGNPGLGDSGGASRFFYTSKVRPDERNLGGIDCRHPTLKPLDLCEYLARLILPPKRPDAPRRLLVPFAGAGSEMIGALEAGWEDVTGIELEEQSVEWARARIAASLSLNPAERTGKRNEAGEVLQPGLFD